MTSEVSNGCYLLSRTYIYTYHYYHNQYCHCIRCQICSEPPILIRCLKMQCEQFSNLAELQFTRSYIRKSFGAAWPPSSVTLSFRSVLCILCTVVGFSHGRPIGKHKLLNFKAWICVTIGCGFPTLAVVLLSSQRWYWVYTPEVLLTRDHPKRKVTLPSIIDVNTQQEHPIHPLLEDLQNAANSSLQPTESHPSAR